MYISEVGWGYTCIHIRSLMIQKCMSRGLVHLRLHVQHYTYRNLVHTCARVHVSLILLFNCYTGTKLFELALAMLKQITYSIH